MNEDDPLGPITAGVLGGVAICAVWIVYLWFFTP